MERDPGIAQVLRAQVPRQQRQYIEAIEAQLVDLHTLPHPRGVEGVFCTTDSWQNSVLWSHYTSVHSGVAIEIDTQGIAALTDGCRVRYAQQIQPVHLYKRNAEDMLLRTFATKYIDWAYEREVRFFGPAGNRAIDRAAIKSVTFGVNARRANWRSWKYVYRLVQLNLPDCRIFEIRHDRTSYRLQRRELDRTLLTL